MVVLIETFFYFSGMHGWLCHLRPFSVFSGIHVWFCHVLYVFSSSWGPWMVGPFGAKTVVVTSMCRRKVSIAAAAAVNVSAVFAPCSSSAIFGPASSSAEIAPGSSLAALSPGQLCVSCYLFMTKRLFACGRVMTQISVHLQNVGAAIRCSKVQQRFWVGCSSARVGCSSARVGCYSARVGCWILVGRHQ